MNITKVIIAGIFLMIVSIYIQVHYGFMGNESVSNFCYNWLLVFILFSGAMILIGGYKHKGE